MTPAEYCGIAQSAAQGVHEEVRERQSERFERNQRQDDKEAPMCIYEPGQKIFLKYPKGTFRKPGGTTKFSQVNNGPYTIKRRIETSSGATVYEVEHDTTKYRCKVGHRRIIPYDEWDLPVGASRPRLLPGEMAEHKRTKQSLNQADEAEPMEIDSGDDQAELPGDDKAIADHELDQVLGDFQAREAIIGTDSDNSDCEQASEMEPIPAGVASARAAKDIGNSRADEVRDFPERTAQEMPERRSLRTKPTKATANNEYARTFKTTAAERRRRRPRVINMMGYFLKLNKCIQRADADMLDIWDKFRHP